MDTQLLDSIAQVFQQDHDHINSLLLEYFTPVTNKGANSEYILKTVWIIERHMFLEEKVLVQYFNLKQIEDIQTIVQFYSEHNEIIDLLSKIKKSNKYDPTESLSVTIAHLHEIILSHKDFEMTHFYNEMDNQLSSNEKNKILRTLQDSIQKGFYPIAKIRDLAKNVFKNVPEILALLS